MRTCEICERELREGFTNAERYVCEEHFKKYLNETYGSGGWRMNEHEASPDWTGGYYDYLDNGVWYDTGFYWTEWDDYSDKSGCHYYFQQIRRKQSE